MTNWQPTAPTSWRIHRLKWCFVSCRNGVWGDEPNGEDDIVVVRVADFDRVGFRVSLDNPTKRAITQSERANRELNPSILLIEKSGGGDLQPVGFVVSYDHDVTAVCSNFVARLEVAQECEPRFMTYLNAHLYSNGINQRSIKQTTGIQNLDAEAYLNETVAVPDRPTQHRIAAYLDAETAAIDLLIAEKERLLALLEEQRAAVVTHAVTRGLDPNAPLKPSGLEWLGDVPQDWHIMRFKHFAQIGNGSTPNRDKPEYWEGGEYPWLNSSVVGDRTVQEESRFVTEIALEECHLPRIEPPALLVAITGQGKTRGRSTILNFEATINQHLAFVKPEADAADCLFLSFVMDTAYAFIRSDSDGAGSTRGAITCEQLGNFRVPLPSFPEQRAILSFIQEGTKRFDTMQQAATDSLNLLRERRSALITAAVTGQIPIEEMQR